MADLDWFLNAAKEYGPDLIAAGTGAYSAYKGTEDATTKPWYLPGQEQALADSVQSAKDLYDLGPKQYYPDSTVAGQDPNLVAGQNQQLGQMDRMNQMGEGSAQAALGLAQGGADRIGGFQLQDQIGFGIPEEYQNAIMNPIMDRLNEQIIPGLHTQATQQGAFGGSRMQQQKADATTQATKAATDAMIQGNLQARGQSIGQRAGDISAQLQGRGQDIQQNALENQAVTAGINGMGTAMNQLVAPGQLQTDIGNQRTAYDQARLNDDVARFNFNQDAPGNALDDLNARLQGIAPRSGQVVEGQGGDWMDAIAGGLGGINAWNQISGTGAK